MADELILIVEDNEKNLKLVRDLLQVKGYRTLEAGTGELGVELARRHTPHLILMDIQLPGLDGVAALGQLRAEPTTASIPVIALTAFANESRLPPVRRGEGGPDPDLPEGLQCGRGAGRGRGTGGADAQGVFPASGGV